MPQLEKFKNPEFNRGASKWKEAVWLLVQGVFFDTWLPGTKWRVVILKWFGASVGRGVVIKPHVRIKFPWKLSLGDFVWIGEGVWIDNLARVNVGSSVCLSQGVLLETGSHDYKDPLFRLVTKPIVIEDGVWVCAMSRIAPGVRLRRNAVIGLGAVMTKDAEECAVYQGNPAVKIRERGLAE